MSSKVCSKCKEEKPLGAFSKCRVSKDGLQYQCKVCRKQYRQDNRVKRAEYYRQYYQDNRERILEVQKQYYQDNYEYCVEKYAKRRALKREAIPEALLNCPIEKDRLEKSYKLRSLLTKATGVEYHVDHIWPLSKGGPHWSGNLQVITAEENWSKSDSMCEDTARVIQESLDNLLSNAVVIPKEPKVTHTEDDF